MRDPHMRKNHILLLFYIGTCIKTLYLILNENRTINKDFPIYRVSRVGEAPLFNCPISLKIESHKMFIWFDTFPVSSQYL